MRAVIAVQGLTKVFGRQRAVDDLSFEVEPGRITGFLGPNGAGKTTTMRVVLGLAAPTSGAALVFGGPYAELEHPAAMVGALLDSGSFHPSRTARNHLRWVAAAGGVGRQRIEDVLEQVDLLPAADRRVGEFSLGMRQRLGLATALLGEPRLLVLDEPANGLDPGGIRWLRELLRSFAREGGSVFLSSHLLGEIAQLADEVLVIDQGRLLAHTTVEELTAGAGRRTRVRTPHPHRLIPLLEAKGAEVRTDRDGALEIRGIGPEGVGEAAARAGIVLHELIRGTHTLEDGFFELTREEDDHVAIAQG